MWPAQIAMFAFAAASAFLLRFDFNLAPGNRRQLLYALSVWLLVKIVVFHTLKLDRGSWRHVSVVDLGRVALGNGVGSALSCMLILALGPADFPRSIYLLDFIICLLGTGGIRLIIRGLSEFIAASRGRKASAKCTLIYGAGDAGATLLREIRNNERLAYRVVGFLDDSPQKLGLRIRGVPVLGGAGQVKAIVAHLCVEMILIAIPSASGAEMTRIMEVCHAAGVTFKTIPGLGEMLEEQGLAGQIREVAVEDLLGRTPVRLDESQIRGSVQGKVVMVTGAAGSIGSELCRQLARFGPRSIVGFDIAESPLFEIDREMHQRFPLVPFHPEIGSVQNRARLHDVLSQYEPSLVYHAAAYKHVPLMEAHVFEAIENNVFGTYCVAEAAGQHGVEDFVMISSDKAVRPTNVMGATKRVAELVLLALQNGHTKYVAVRFGNVLGSNGSVIPIFKRQISAGGPITVTHPEMRRFFMTIPEATQLVLQAAAIGEGGQICVLDMGQPVKIVDLAKNLILLSGLRPNEDIRITFTGMRPGEKLFEELSTLLEDTVATIHDKIRIFVGSGAPPDDLQTWMENLHDICQNRDTGRLIFALKELVPDYNPSSDLLKRVIRVQNGSSPRLMTV